MRPFGGLPAWRPRPAWRDLSAQDAPEGHRCLNAPGTVLPARTGRARAGRPGEEKKPHPPAWRRAVTRSPIPCSGGSRPIIIVPSPLSVPPALGPPRSDARWAVDSPADVLTVNPRRGCPSRLVPRHRRSSCGAFLRLRPRCPFTTGPSRPIRTRAPARRCRWRSPSGWRRGRSRSPDHPPSDSDSPACDAPVKRSPNTANP